MRIQIAESFVASRHSPNNFRNRQAFAPDSPQLSRCTGHGNRAASDDESLPREPNTLDL
jgi:hypothetical protein